MRLDVDSWQVWFTFLLPPASLRLPRPSPSFSPRTPQCCTTLWSLVALMRLSHPYAVITRTKTNCATTKRKLVTPRMLKLSAILWTPKNSLKLSSLEIPRQLKPVCKLTKLHGMLRPDQLNRVCNHKTLNTRAPCNSTSAWNMFVLNLVALKLEALLYKYGVN